MDSLHASLTDAVENSVLKYPDHTGMGDCNFTPSDELHFLCKMLTYMSLQVRLANHITQTRDIMTSL